MKMVVRAFALVLFVATVGVWAGLGGSLGWTESQAASTGAPAAAHSTVWKPGIEFLGLGVGGAVVIFAATLFVRITPKP
ncbi:MAG: hypothetical protein ACREKL_03450 [Chthoniobacterales bacterium]